MQNLDCTNIGESGSSNAATGDDNNQETNCELVGIAGCANSATGNGNTQDSDCTNLNFACRASAMVMIIHSTWTVQTYVLLV